MFLCDLCNFITKLGQTNWKAIRLYVQYIGYNLSFFYVVNVPFLPIFLDMLISYIWFCNINWGTPKACFILEARGCEEQNFSQWEAWKSRRPRNVTSHPKFLVQGMARRKMIWRALLLSVAIKVHNFLVP
jgi:hypothetical protein